jgi:SPP1 gp7 family putative phage head morphogenesis protein
VFWRATASHSRFQEALEWFQRRAVITGAEAARLNTDLKVRAFWIGGGLQLNTIQNVFDKIDRAIDSGEPFDEWRERVRGQLSNDAHAETVFRNAVQRSLNAGRFRQAHDPEVLRLRPFAQFDAILDSRTTKICKDADGTILPVDDPWVLRNQCPRHHKCRSGWRYITEREARRRGISDQPPDNDAAPGFGAPPDADPPWKPDPAKHDPALYRELERKQSAPPPAPKPKPPPEHSAAHWEKHYQKQYGEAAPAVGYGRAALERGLDRPVQDIRAELQRLVRDGFPDVGLVDIDSSLAAFDQMRPMRAQVTLPEHRYAAALVEHVRSIKPAGAGAFPLAGPSDPRVAPAQRFYELLTDKSVPIPRNWKWEQISGNRSSAVPNRRLIKLGLLAGADSLVHEMGHAIELAGPALKRSKAFLAVRTKGESLQKLAKLFPGRGYKPKEVAWPDQFFSPYVGRDYSVHGLDATEILSMGFQAMAGRRANLKAMLTKDPEMLYFLLGQLAGR